MDTSSQSLQAQPLEPKTEPINETTMEGVPNLPPHLQGEFMQNLEQMQMKDSLSWVLFETTSCNARCKCDDVSPWRWCVAVSCRALCWWPESIHGEKIVQCNIWVGTQLRESITFICGEADVSSDEEGCSETLHVTRDVLTTMRCCRQLTTWRDYAFLPLLLTSFPCYTETQTQLNL